MEFYKCHITIPCIFCVVIHTYAIWQQWNHICSLTIQRCFIIQIFLFFAFLLFPDSSTCSHNPTRLYITMDVYLSAYTDIFRSFDNCFYMSGIIVYIFFRVFHSTIFHPAIPPRRLVWIWLFPDGLLSQSTGIPRHHFALMGIYFVFYFSATV